MSPERQPTPASMLNPEAGMHPMASDPRELAAGMAAGERSLREFPYFERRYGERGRRFCGSDTAWLITLCERGRSDAFEQVQWLGRVLSARGMPQYLLERHLLALHDELTRAIPRERRRYAVLDHCRKRLTAQRHAHIAEAEFAALAAKFETRVGNVPGAVNAMGELLVAAVVDEALGLDRAVPSLEAWVCDGDLFPAKWTRAARETIAAAREQIGV